VRLVIFDMDGTLIDSAALIVETVTAAFQSIGETAPVEHAIRAISGISLHEAIALLAPEAGDARVLELVESYRTQYRQRAGDGREPLFQGALDALERLRARPDTILAVATGKGHSGAVALLNSHGILDRFQSIQTPDHNRGKPDPQMIETAIAHAGAAKESTVMIGDTLHDMRMARAAGVAAIGVSWGYHTVAELEAEGADVIIHTWDQLDGAVERLTADA
jgi:phosphoglycolate phosphatase